MTTGKSKAAIVDLGRKKVIARPNIGLPTRDVALSLDGLRAYVVASDGAGGRLTAIDLQSRAIVGQLAVPAGARGVALSADGTRAYVTSGGRTGKLTVVNLLAGAVASEITLPRRPAAIALSPDGARAFVVSGTRKLAIVDLVALRTVKSVRVGRKPFDVVVHPGGGAVFVTNAGGRSVSVVSPSALRVARTIRLSARSRASRFRAAATAPWSAPGRRSRKAIVLRTGGRARARRISSRQGPVVRRLLPHGRAHLHRQLGLGDRHVRERLQLPPPPRAACAWDAASRAWRRSRDARW